MEGVPQSFLILSSRLSFAALRVSLCRRDETGAAIERAHCTGFLWQRDVDHYLITNWHCVTGWHPTENRALDDMCFDPEIAATQVTMSSDGGKAPDGTPLFKTSTGEVVVELRADGRPVWLEHPRFGSRVDVIAIKLGSGPSGLMSAPINTIEFKDLDVLVGDEAFVIGFPMDSKVAYPYPIWKRASLATEPQFDIDGLPMMLIDTATRPGMSGSPVFARQLGVTRQKGKVVLGGGDAKCFLGVYSSRVGDLTGLQLGTVWKPSVIDEIIEGGVIGKGPYDP
jgi:hypothetical protein